MLSDTQGRQSIAPDDFHFHADVLHIHELQGWFSFFISFFFFWKSSWLTFNAKFFIAKYPPIQTDRPLRADAHRRHQSVRLDQNPRSGKPQRDYAVAPTKRDGWKRCYRKGHYSRWASKLFSSTSFLKNLEILPDFCDFQRESDSMPCGTPEPFWALISLDLILAWQLRPLPLLCRHCQGLEHNLKDSRPRQRTPQKSCYRSSY